MRGKLQRATLTLTLAVASFAATPNSAMAQSPWPFDPPPIATLRNSPHKVFAHYFTPFPISIGNTDPSRDYYATGYLDPHGEHDKWLTHGGFLRERPLPRRPVASADWEEQDLATDIRRAAAMGIDGFTVDLMGPPIPTNSNWRRVVDLIETAQRVDPGFRFVPMPDCTAGYGPANTNLIDAITALSKYPNVERLADGRMVVSPYCAQRESPSFWQGGLSK